MEQGGIEGVDQVGDRSNGDLAGVEWGVFGVEVSHREADALSHELGVDQFSGKDPFVEDHGEA